MEQFFNDAYTDDGFLRVDMMERARKVFKNTISDEGIRTFYHDRWLDWHYPRGGSVI
jgi:hypothetical protein